jgi:glycosyltransferase involved in cell wall biosynthesis
MRILQVVPTYYPAVRYGGPVRSVHGLAKALVRRGHDVQVYTTSVDGDQDLDVQLGKAIELDGVQVLYFGVPALRRLYWAPALGRKLRESVSEFDILHLHSVYLWPTWAAARAARLLGVPYFISPRGMLVADLIRKKSRWVKTAWIELIERHSLAAAAGVHVTSELEASDISRLGLKVRAVHCIGNGVEWPERYAPLSAGPFAGVPQPYALFLSRINWKKGLDRLIQAWSRVRELHLLVVGNDEEDYLPQLRALVEKEGVADRVHFLGPASDTAKWALYENASMFVLPSYSENFGNVVAEAMAMGCPVVVTPEVGLANLVREIGSGIVCPGEPSGIADAVNTLGGDAALRKAMGVRGQMAVKQRLSWDAVAESMENAYQQTVAQPLPGIAGRA